MFDAVADFDERARGVFTGRISRRFSARILRKRVRRFRKVWMPRYSPVSVTSNFFSLLEAVAGDAGDPAVVGA